MKSTLRNTAVAVALAGTACAQNLTVTFDEPPKGLQHGSILTDGSYADVGLTIRAGFGTDYDRANRAIIFDTNEDNTRDPDLEAPFIGGNLVGRTDLGNALIIAENMDDLQPQDGIIDNPDDNAGGGFVFVRFESDLVDDFGFSVYDTPERNAEVAFSLTLTDSSGSSSTLFFPDILARNPSVSTGDSFANEYAPISASSVGLSNIKAATFELDGSGAIDTLTFTVVPEPSTSLLAGLAALGLLARRRR